MGPPNNAMPKVSDYDDIGSSNSARKGYNNNSSSSSNQNQSKYGSSGSKAGDPLADILGAGSADLFTDPIFDMPKAKNTGKSYDAVDESDSAGSRCLSLPT